MYTGTPISHRSPFGLVGPVRRHSDAAHDIGARFRPAESGRGSAVPIEVSVKPSEWVERTLTSPPLDETGAQFGTRNISLHDLPSCPPNYQYLNNSVFRGLSTPMRLRMRSTASLWYEGMYVLPFAKFTNIKALSDKHALIVCCLLSDKGD